MNECKWESMIDDYLLNRLNNKNNEKFEKHYFNCSTCFERLTERDELISVIKQKGDVIFRDIAIKKTSKNISLATRIRSFLTPQQWAVTAVSAALILIIVLGIIPNFKTKSSPFYLDENATRGKSITLISDAIPSEFRWESVGEASEYRITIYNHEVLWDTTTRNNFISLPKEIKDKMTPHVKYFWQVKAFSSEGTLIAESSKVQLPVTTQ